MKRQKTPLLFLSIFLLLILGACGSPKNTPSPDSDASSPSEGKQDSVPAASENTSLRLALPDGICAQVADKIPASTLSVQRIDSAASEDSRISLLENDSSDVILLSPQRAAELYRNGKSIQLLALVSAGTSDQFDGMECLVSSSGFLAENPELIARFLSAYQSLVSEQAVTGAFLASGWDMVDLVQQALEVQYQNNPDPNHKIPDGKFYYFPS